MNSPTRNQRNVMSGVVAAFERLVARRRAQSTHPVPVFQVAAGTTRTPIHLHDGGLGDNGVLLLHDRSASDQTTLRREPASVRAHRCSAARAEKAGRLTTVLAGYVPWWRHRTNEAASRYEGGNLKTLIEAMPVAVIVVDDDHMVVLANEPAAALFGYTTNELRGLSFVQLCPRMADNPDSEVGSSGRFLPGSRFAAIGARRMAVARARDGSERSVSVQFKQYGTGAAPWIVTIVDPGESSQTSADELNRAQFGRVSELGEMAAALAHEINQPLTAILGNAQAAQRFLASSDSDPSNLREALTDIVDDSFRATEIVRKLRQLVRGATPEMRPLDIETLVREATHLMRRTALARGVSVALDIDEHLPEVRGDKIQLQQVMINLLQNAFDAVETCSVERRLVSVEVRGVPQESAVSIAVSDRGPGLKADQVGDVFKPFSTSKMHGLGLGLSISSSIISIHGGRLWADNNDNGGATFHIQLSAAGGSEGSGSR